MTLDRVADAHVMIAADYDEARARETLARVDEAMARWIASTVELADLVYRTQRDQCWRVDEEYRTAVASGTVVPQKRGDRSTDQQRTWLAWRFQRSARMVRYLGDYGQLRAILSADPELPPLEVPERAARPLAVLLRPRYNKSERADEAEHHAALRAIWLTAVRRVETPAAAIPEAISEAKYSDYAPIRRIFNRTHGLTRAQRESQAVSAERMLRYTGRRLLELGEIGRFDAAIAALVEARDRYIADDDDDDENDHDGSGDVDPEARP